MKYTVCLNGYGSECVVGVIPDEIWKYIQDECDGDADNYWYKLNEGEVPEEFKLADDISTFDDTSCFFQRSGASPDLEIQVYDEQHHEVLKADCKDVEKNFLELNPAAKAKYYFVWRAVLKGIWETAEIETDEPFDKSKLKLQVHHIVRNDPYSTIEFIESIVYNDEEYQVNLEIDEEFDEIYELTFYKDQKPEEDDQTKTAYKLMPVGCVVLVQHCEDYVCNIPFVNPLGHVTAILFCLPSLYQCNPLLLHLWFLVVFQCQCCPLFGHGIFLRVADIFFRVTSESFFPLVFFDIRLRVSYDTLCPLSFCEIFCFSSSVCGLPPLLLPPSTKLYVSLRNIQVSSTKTRSI